MENNTILNPMSEFDFGLPIDVTIIFEEGDSETSLTNSLNEKYKNIRHDNNIKESPYKETTENCDSECYKVVKKSENLNKSSSLNKVCTIQKKKTIYGNISQKSMEKIIVDYENALSDDGKNFETVNHINFGIRQINHNETVSNQHSLIVRGETPEETDSNADVTPSTYHQIDQHEQVTTFIEDMLNTLSEHLILIMQLYYQFGIKRKRGPLATRGFRKRKKVSQLFELSYNTVDSIILPQEQNKTFINNFLDKTVILANSKSLKWKCQRCHVEPFFQELVKWSKQKRAQTKAFKQQVSSCENIILKRHLARPALSLNLPHSKSVPISDKVLTPDTHTNVCVFSSGTPGSEISINVSPETLTNCTQGQYKNSVEWTGNQNYYPSCVQSAQKEAPPPYNSQRHDVTNSTKYHCYPQPYSMIPSSENFINNTNHNNQNIVHPIQNYQNIGQPLQNQQNIGQPIQHYLTQVQYVNATQKSPCETALVKALNNIRQNIQTQSENASRPVITNVTSLNPTACMRISGRCCMCGKNIEIPCSLYNPACKPSYCSYLCQELNKQISRTACGDT